MTRPLNVDLEFSPLRVVRALWSVAWVVWQVIVLTFALYLVVASALWCLDGALNVLEAGTPPGWAFAALLIVVGSTPAAAGVAAYKGQARPRAVVRSLTVAAYSSVPVSLVVLLFRSAASGGL